MILLEHGQNGANSHNTHNDIPNSNGKVPNDDIGIFKRQIQASIAKCEYIGGPTIYILYFNFISDEFGQYSSGKFSDGLDDEDIGVPGFCVTGGAGEDGNHWAKEGDKCAIEEVCEAEG